MSLPPDDFEAEAEIGTGSAEQLQPLSFPLKGSQLIEASAGTGKTYTIALLYVRLILGHGGENGFHRPLTPPEILVVTFTDAATKELRDRVRSRLAETAALFSLPEDADTRGMDELLLQLKNEYSPDEWPECARVLRLAAEWMDDSAISTIHSWCNRMLREHAFDSGSLFTQSLETDQSELLAEVIRDYWRIYIQTLKLEFVEAVKEWWSGPEGLQNQLKGLLAHVDLLDKPSASPSETLTHYLAERNSALAKLKEPWGPWVEELRSLLDEARDKKLVDGRRLQQRNYYNWLNGLAIWRDTDGQVEPIIGEGIRRLTPEGLADIWKLDKSAPPDHPALTAIKNLESELAALPNAAKPIIFHAAHWVSERFAKEQQTRSQMGFDDLLTGLDKALAGANSAQLTAIIRQQFPVALIDEFQDTDPIQYRIFNAVYRVEDNDPDTALIMIGDPKQAIYSFRGADIYTYMRARRECGKRLHTLKKNFRSSTAMVRAVNHCFALAESRSERGAFLFRNGSDNPVPFVTADAHGREEVFEIDGTLQTALTVWLSPEAERADNADELLASLAKGCAREVVALLNQGQAQAACFNGPKGKRAVQPADIAILVNTATEAQAVRLELARRGVRSVYLSDQDSVYQSAEAGEVQLWLQASADPGNQRHLRAALATRSLGLDWQAIDALNHDERAVEARILQFHRYRDIWRKQGVLPMLRNILNDFDAPAKLLRRNLEPGQEGERALTNILHLAELLQAAATTQEGEHALLRFLSEHIKDNTRTGGPDDAKRIRLESDADLVKVITIHKSKGLEYNLVFLPFIYKCRKVQPKKDFPIKWHDEQGDLMLELDQDKGHAETSDQERLGEDLRKLYVGMTRARHATWMGVAVGRDVGVTAIAHLLGFSGEKPSFEQVETALNALKDQFGEIRVTPPPLEEAGIYEESAASAPELSALKAVRPIPRDWWISSYSSLKKLGGGESAAAAESAETPREENFRELQAGADTAGTLEPRAPARRPVAVVETDTLHGFPAGAHAGTFLHDLLEWAANRGFAETLANPEALIEEISRRCKARGWDSFKEPLSGWVLHFLDMPFHTGISETPLRFGSLKRYQPEMEFWIMSNRVAIGEIDRLVNRYALPGQPRPAIKPGHLNGMLKGFIDLVFELDGRFYVADYKSNQLGSEDAAYTPEALREATLHSRYELQYVLYLLALHRHLKSRIPGYDYDRHMGGAVYLYLRGSHSASQGVLAERPPRVLIETLDSLFTGRMETP